MTTIEPVRWGILGTANIAVNKVVPAMRSSRLSKTIAIASRDIEKARSAARALGIPRAYGSYEELIADPKIEALQSRLSDGITADSDRLNPPVAPPFSPRPSLASRVRGLFGR